MNTRTGTKRAQNGLLRPDAQGIGSAQRKRKGGVKMRKLTRHAARSGRCSWRVRCHIHVTYRVAVGLW